MKSVELNEKEDLNSIKKGIHNGKKKYKTSKSNLIISIIIAVPYVLGTILMPTHATLITGSLLGILAWSSLAAWIKWRLSGRKEKGGSLTFKIVLVLIFIGQFTGYGINLLENHFVNESSFSEKRVTLTEQSEIEKFVLNHIQSLGYETFKVKLVRFVDMGSEHYVFILSYKTNDFDGAYFLCPEVGRYVIYDTDDDMKLFKTINEIGEDAIKITIRSDFRRLADFEFPAFSKEYG